MENAVDALKMAFAIIIFVIAITITFSCVSQAKEASDVILKNIDKTNFYENLKPNELETTNGGKEVGIDTVISNLYRIEKESFEVKIIFNEYDQLSLGLNNLTSEQLRAFINSIKRTYIDTDITFIETFSEVTYTGKYITGEDGSQITVTPGLKKIYITYTNKDLID